MYLIATLHPSFQWLKKYSQHAVYIYYLLMTFSLLTYTWFISFLSLEKLICSWSIWFWSLITKGACRLPCFFSIIGSSLVVYLPPNNDFQPTHFPEVESSHLNLAMHDLWFLEQLWRAIWSSDTSCVWQVAQERADSPPATDEQIDMHGGRFLMKYHNHNECRQTDR